MIAFDEAVARVLGLATPLGAERAALADAAGRVLAAPLVARGESPRWAVSTMDGYAVAGEAPVGARFRVIGQSQAGAGFEGRVDQGETVRIFTGAPLPPGADRVVIQENIDREGDTATVTGVSGGRHVRARASDFAAGSVLLEAGTVLGPRAMVAAAAADRAEIEVFRRPGVVVLGTGDELVAPGQALESAFAIPESVSFGVAGLAEAWGGTALARRRLPDDLAALQAGACEALEEADVVVVTGGASVGERDFAKAAFGEDLHLVFSKVAIKPGKPVWLGRVGAKLVVGLPGNPTSAMVTGRLLLAPLLMGLAGRDPAAALAWTRAVMATPLPATGDRETFYRASLRADGVHLLSDQDSGGQSALARADLLVRRLAGAPALAPGEAADVLAF